MTILKSCPSLNHSTSNAATKSNRSEDKGQLVKEAYNSLQARGERISMSAMSRASSLSKKAIKNYLLKHDPALYKKLTKNYESLKGKKNLPLTLAQTNVLDRYHQYLECNAVPPTVSQLAALARVSNDYAIRRLLKEHELVITREAGAFPLHRNSEWAVYLPKLPLDYAAIVERGRYLLMGGRPIDIDKDVRALIYVLSSEAFEDIAPPETEAQPWIDLIVAVSILHRWKIDEVTITGKIVPACLKKKLHSLSPELRKMQRLALTFYKAAKKYVPVYESSTPEESGVPDEMRVYVDDTTKAAYDATIWARSISLDRYDGMTEIQYRLVQAEMEKDFDRHKNMSARTLPVV